MGVLACSGLFTANRLQVPAIGSSMRIRSAVSLHASNSKQSEPPSEADVFAEKERIRAAVSEKRKKDKEVKRRKTSIKLKKFLEPGCYGCGATLQCTNEDSPGYLTEDVFMLKKKHRQLSSVLCTRCRLMSHGKLIPAVGGYGVYGKEKGFVTAEELRKQLAHIREERLLVVKLVDIVDFSGSFITRLRDLIGSNPIVLVATKVDLLPDGTSLAAVGDWILETTLKKKLNVISIHLASSKSVMGISNVVKEIQRERQGRDVYVLGAANVGKSAFIIELLREMATRDPFAAVAKRYKPVQSILPGTTIGPICINAFSGGGSLYDTPGVHVHHRIETAISPDDLPMLFPPRRLRGYVVSPILEIKGAQTLFTEALLHAEGPKRKKSLEDLSGMSMFWGGIARVDIIKAPSNVKLTFYGSSSLRVHKVPTVDAEEFYSKELGKKLVPPSGDEKAKLWPGLTYSRKFTLSYDTTKPVGDIAISGLGWLSMEFVSREDAEEQDLEVQVNVPKGIEIFLRSSIPVGVSGSRWYTFSELDEEEEKKRPRLYYPAMRDAAY